MGDVLEQITDCGEALAVSPVAVHTVIYGDKADIVARKDNIRILSNSQIVTTKSAEVFLCQVGTKKILRIYKPFIGGQPPVNGLHVN